MRLLSCFPITPGVGRAGLSRSVCTRPALSASIIWATMCMNGAAIGTTPATTAVLPTEIRKGLPTLAAEPREVAPGATTSKLPARQRDRVFRSEERRVGKEWRDAGGAEQVKNKE